MSLAVLARKTREKRKMNMRSKKSFALNMTGRGNVRSSKVTRWGCGGNKPCAAKSVGCCGSKCAKDCVAQQMSYNTYLKRQSGMMGLRAKNKITWKQSPDNSASAHISDIKGKMLTCPKAFHTKGKEKKDMCCEKKIGCGRSDWGCGRTDVVRYNRINSERNPIGKYLPHNRSAGEQTAIVRASTSCTGPKTIYLAFDGDSNGSKIWFKGCCKPKCLVPGETYNFVFNNILGGNDYSLVFIWCTGLTKSVPLVGGEQNIVLQIPKFSNGCGHDGKVTLSIDGGSAFCRCPLKASLDISYCKSANTKPHAHKGCA